MKNHSITIITPIYNEEKNIQDYIKVLTSQSCQNFHVILIDDGSTDSTMEIASHLLHQLQPEFSFEIIQKQNGGAAKAREFGIRASHTEYILILDCDDKMSSTTIEEHYKTINAQKPDIILPIAKVQDKNGVYEDFLFFDNLTSHSGLTCFINSLGKWGVHGWMCARREIFLKSYSVYNKYNPNHINYVNNDEILVRLNFFNANTVIKNEAVYFYENNLESTTKKINPNRYLLCENAMILCEIFKDQPTTITKKSYKELINILWGTTKYCQRHSEQLQNLQDWANVIEKTFKYIEKNKIFKSLSLKSKIRLLHSKFTLNKVKTAYPFLQKKSDTFEK